MLITGSINLNDSSRHLTNTGRTGFSFEIAPPDLMDATAITYIPSSRIPGDATYFQGQIIGRGDLTLELKNWIYFGGRQLPDTTWVDGTWMWRWFSPIDINYQIWHRPYDSSVFRLYGCPFREPVLQNVGNYYASMIVPQTPGHYEIRWIYLKDYSTLGRQVVESFTSMSRGINSMPDYPYPAGTYGDGTNVVPSEGPYVTTWPTYETRNVGDSAIFTLQPYGAIPSPISYQWRFNGNSIHDSTKYSGTTTDTLTIYNLITADGGSFNCVVSSKLVSSIAWLIIDPP